MSSLLESLDAVDRDVFLWINGGLHRLRSEIVRDTLHVFNQMGNAWVVVIVLACVAVMSSSRRLLVRRVLDVALSQGATALLVPWLKRVVARPRPLSGLASEFEEKSAFLAFGESGLRTSLPSGHAVTAFTLAAVLSSWALRLPPGPRRTLGCVLPFVAASITGVARVYAGMHYPGDVLVGALLGTALGLGAIAILRAAFRDDRTAPPMAPPPSA